jgi:DUF1680 family protein
VGSLAPARGLRRGGGDAVTPAQVELRDRFWSPRLAALRESTLPTLLERLEAHGVVEAFARVRMEQPPPRTTSWLGAIFCDSDLYKWIEAAALAGHGTLLEPLLEPVLRAQDADGYLHTFFGHDGRERYVDLDHGHELYCMGHFVEAAVSHHRATGRRDLLDAALRVGEHVAATFGPGRREQVDQHPEVELALCRLAAVGGGRSLVDLASWMLEQPLARSGLTLETVRPAGHAVRFLYFASGIAEVALATGDARWREAALRLWREVVDRHSYCTGAVGGRWMGEAIGRPYELDDETSYAESCAAVAMAQLTDRAWRLGGDPGCLDHLDTLLFNSLPAAIGADGASWCYSNALAFTGDGEQNPWVLGFEYGPAMALRWFPPRRHGWFDVMCCPPNVARAFASVPSWVAETSVEVGRPTLLIRLPVACRVTGDEWDVELETDWPESGAVDVEVRRAPAGGRLCLRRPGEGIEELATDAKSRLELPVRAGWCEARPELSAMSGKVFLRRGPVVYALDDRDLPGVDLRRLRIDVAAPVDDTDPNRLRTTVEHLEADPTGRPLYTEVDRLGPARRLVDATLRPYHAWPDGVGQLRIWLSRSRA